MDWLQDRVGGLELLLVVVAALLLNADEIDRAVLRLLRGRGDGRR